MLKAVGLLNVIRHCDFVILSSFGFRHSSFVAIFGALMLVTVMPLGAQTQTRPGAQTLNVIPEPITAVAEPSYGRTTLVSPDMIRRRPRQVIVLPSEPGEVGEDSLQLSSGVLGRLPAEAPRLPEGYMVSGAPASVGRRGDWTLLYIGDEELFSIPLAQNPGVLDGAGKLTLSPALMRLFEDNRAALAADAEVIVLDKGRQWRLADPDRAYLIEKEAGRLSVRRARMLRVLPNKRLMMLEAIFEAASEPPRFVATGRITEFQGVNHILIENLAEVIDVPESVRGSGHTGTAKPAATPAEAAVEQSPAAATEPAKGSAAPAPAGREPRAEDIIAELMESKPLRAVVLPEHEVRLQHEAASRPADVPAVAGRKLPWVEDTMLIDRPGRVVPGERWWMLAFEDRGEVPESAPVPILPNRMLETALAMSGGASKGMVFVVSGEVTEYRGGNYLLLRKVLVQPDMGNLR